MKHVAVIGGGISGLSALHTLKRKLGPSHELRLIDAHKVGGWLETASRKYGGAQGGGVHRFEKGPRSMRAAEKGQASLVLISQLPSLASRLVSSSEASSTRLLYLNGQVTPLPSSLFGLFQSPVTRKFIPNGIKNFFANHKPTDDDESIASFFERHMGKDFTRNILAGVVVGIYGGSIDKLSVNACFPSIARIGRDYGSLVRGFLLKPATEGISKRILEDLACTDEERRAYEQLSARIAKAGTGVFTFKDGIDEFPKALADLHDRNIMGGAVEEIYDAGDDGDLVYYIEGAEGPMWGNDSLVCSIPAFKLAKLVEGSSPTASALLKEIEFIDMAVVSVAFEEKPGTKIIPEEKVGFGYLVPPIANKAILGVSFDSVTFPDQSRPNLVRMAVMIGGDPSLNEVSRNLNVATTSKESLLDIALQSLRDDLGIKDVPVSTDVSVAINAIPQYTVGHSERVRKIRAALAKDLPGLHICGASYDGVGINDCVVSGIDAALAAFGSAQRRTGSSL